jgi:hypothetical protein
VKGFHVCKAGNAPTVGQVKSLIVAGDRIKSKKVEEGGQNYTIMSVTPRDSYKDTYGNVGYDIEIEPATGQQGTGAPPPHRSGNGGGGMSKDDYWTRKEERDIEASQRMNRSHAQDMAIQWITLLTTIGAMPPEEAKTPKKLREIIDFFQKDSWRTATDTASGDDVY